MIQFILTNSVAFAKAFLKWGITSPLRVWHFLAQFAHESNDFKSFTENLNYTPEGLISTFGTARISLAQAQKYGRVGSKPADQEAIANIVYGGEWGRKNLGNTLPGDGWRFRGRGGFQTTGRANYEEYKRETGIDVVSNPDLMATINVAIDSAGLYWKKRNLNALADKNDIEGITKKINPKMLGLDKRKNKFDYFKTQNISLEFLKKKNMGSEPPQSSL